MPSTCVNAKRIEVLHVADSDTVTSHIPHHLVLHLLPAEQRLLHEDLAAHGQSLERVTGSTIQMCLQPRARRHKSVLTHLQCTSYHHCYANINIMDSDLLSIESVKFKLEGFLYHLVFVILTSQTEWKCFWAWWRCPSPRQCSSVIKGGCNCFSANCPNRLVPLTKRLSHQQSRRTLCRETIRTVFDNTQGQAGLKEYLDLYSCLILEEGLENCPWCGSGETAAEYNWQQNTCHWNFQMKQRKKESYKETL